MKRHGVNLAFKTLVNYLLNDLLAERQMSIDNRSGDSSMPLWGKFGGMLRRQRIESNCITWRVDRVMNPPLSAKTKERAAHWAAFSFWRREASRLRGLRGGFEGSGLPARPSPNRPTATAAQQQ
jgi:hypothetical protein